MANLTKTELNDALQRALQANLRPIELFAADAVADTIAVVEDTPTAFNVFDQNGNAADMVDASTTVTSFTQPVGGTVTLDENGNGLITPDQDVNGTITSEYTITSFDPNADVTEFELIDTLDTNGGVSDTRDTISISSDGELGARVTDDGVFIFESGLNSTDTGFEINEILEISPQLNEVFNGNSGDVGITRVPNSDLVNVVVGSRSDSSVDLSVFQFDLNDPQNTLVLRDTIDLPSGNAGDGIGISDDGNVLVVGTSFARGASGTDPITPFPTFNGDSARTQAGQLETFIFNNSTGEFDSVELLGNPLNEISAENGAGDRLGRVVSLIQRDDGGYNLFATAHNDSDDRIGGEVLFYQSDSSNPADFTLIGADRQGPGNGRADDEFGQTGNVDPFNPEYFVASSFNGGISLYRGDSSGLVEVVSGIEGGGVQVFSTDIRDGRISINLSNGETVFYEVDFTNDTVARTPGSLMTGVGQISDAGDRILLANDDGVRFFAPAPQSDTATITFNIAAVNDTPLANDDGAGPDNTVGTADDNYVINEGETLDVGAANGLLANDFDVDGDILTVTGVTQPNEGDVTFNPDGSFRFVPNDNNFNGQVSFEYFISDGTGEANGTAQATAFITVLPTNDAPIANDDGAGPDNAIGTADDLYQIITGQVLNVDASNGVLINDVDPDGDLLISTIQTQPMNGSVTLNADGSFSYQSVPGFIGIDTFTYIAEDPSGEQSIGIVTINVLPRPVVPVTVPDAQPILNISTPQVQMAQVVIQEEMRDVVPLPTEQFTLEIDPVDNPTVEDEADDYEIVLATVNDDQEIIRQQYGLSTTGVVSTAESITIEIPSIEADDIGNPQLLEIQIQSIL